MRRSDGERDDQVGGAGEEHGDVHRVERGRPQDRAAAGEQREEPGRRDHGDAVGHDEAELARRLHLVGPAEQVGHRGVLGRDPEHRADLDQQRGDEQPPQRADQRDRDEERAPQEIADDHDPPTVELVGERTGDRAEQQRGQQLRGDDAAEREALRLVSAGELGGEGGEGEEAHPVAHARDRGDEPEPPERRDGEDRSHPVRGGCGRREAGRGGSDGVVPETIAPTPSVPTLGEHGCTPAVHPAARVAGTPDSDRASARFAGSRSHGTMPAAVGRRSREPARDAVSCRPPRCCRRCCRRRCRRRCRRCPPAVRAAGAPRRC